MVVVFFFSFKFFDNFLLKILSEKLRKTLIKKNKKYLNSKMKLLFSVVLFCFMTNSNTAMPDITGTHENVSIKKKSICKNLPKWIFYSQKIIT